MRCPGQRITPAGAGRGAGPEKPRSFCLPSAALNVIGPGRLRGRRARVLRLREEDFRRSKCGTALCSEPGRLRQTDPSSAWAHAGRAAGPRYRASWGYARTVRLNRVASPGRASRKEEHCPKSALWPRGRPRGHPHHQPRHGTSYEEVTGVTPIVTCDAPALGVPT